MNRDVQLPTDNFGLLASGSSGSWTIDLDQSWDGSEWSFQLDGPEVYLTFPIRDPGVVLEAMNYLRAGRSTTELCLGEFNGGRVALNWDDEEVQRWYLIVTPQRGWTTRVTLSFEDAIMMAGALEQMLEDLPH